MDIISSKKPEIPEAQQKPEVKLEYNNRSYESFVNNGFEEDIPHYISAPYDRIRRFIAAVDLNKVLLNELLELL